MSLNSIQRLLAAHPQCVTPEDAILEAARDALDQARGMGFSGPPFDPRVLASLLDILLEGSSAPLPDEAMIFSRNNRLVIAWDETKPEKRISFSIGHEIGHALFPDVANLVRYRSEARPQGLSTTDNIERLCNLAASEFLMPAREFLVDLSEDFSLTLVDALSDRYVVSHEAVTNRVIAFCPDPRAMFVLSSRNKLHESRTARKKLRVDYCVRNQSWCEELDNDFIPPLKSISDASSAYLTLQSNTVGFVRDAVEDWDLRGIQGTFRTESVMLPPHEHDRILLLLTPIDND